MPVAWVDTIEVLRPWNLGHSRVYYTVVLGPEADELDCSAEICSLKQSQPVVKGSFFRF